MNIKVAHCEELNIMQCLFQNSTKKLVKKIGRDRDLNVKKNGIAALTALTRKNGREGGNCGPSFMAHCSRWQLFNEIRYQVNKTFTLLFFISCPFSASGAKHL